MSPQAKLVSSIGGLLLSLLVAIVFSTLGMPGTAAWVGGIFGVLNLLFLATLAPKNNLGGRIVCGVPGIALTMLALGWFMSGIGAVIFLTVCLVLYIGAAVSFD